ncbi:MAG: hypothetical protein J6C58_07405 [Bacteroidaceae bacterium]|nr:hypothetical protein [Bacteroidaceae bacterium]
MMNKVIYENGNYTLITADGQTFPCSRWYEKKTDAWHVKLSKEGQEATGRTYIRESHFANSDTYEFETKTEHRTGLTSGGWRAKMTPEEAEQVAEAEALIERIKTEASKRVIEKVDPNSKEGLELQIQRLMKKLENMR